jgi:hypothetical protein
VPTALRMDRLLVPKDGVEVDTNGGGRG